MIKKIKVGDYYRRDIIKYPCSEGIKFNFDNSGGILQIFYKYPNQKELDNIRSGEIKIGILEKDDVIFLFFKFGNLEWMDVPYSPHLSKEFKFKEITENSGFSITIIFIEAINGEIQCLRLIGAPQKWSEDFKELVLEQKGKMFNVNTYSRNINKIYSSYSTPALVKLANIYKLKK